jgi:hypothetical protein
LGGGNDANSAAVGNLEVILSRHRVEVVRLQAFLLHRRRSGERARTPVLVAIIHLRMRRALDACPDPQTRAGCRHAG